LLLMGSAMLTGVALTPPAARLGTLGRIAHLTIYLPALALYFIVLPRFTAFPRWPPVAAHGARLGVLATSFLGQTVGAWFKHPRR
jgi:ABC-2 type transport system permease protein